jgi:site-specific DNA recombinase
MTKTGIYIRVSTEDQAKEGFSINAQKEKLTTYSKINNWHDITYYIDDGLSGKNINERPNIIKLIDDVKNKKINNILIYKLDRLTRSVKDLINLIEIFENNNCSFNSITEKLDTSTAVGRMFIKIIGTFAEFERENLAERISFGYEQKTKEGNYTNTNGVYGYDYINGKIIINKKEKELINNIYNLYLNGYSMLQIANKLNKENTPTKRNGKWYQSTIKSILTNPLYIGKIRYGLHKKHKSFQVLGKQEKIISINKFNKVQKIIKEKRA